MSLPGFECLCLASHELLPECWREAAAAGPIRLFNPALLRDGAGWRLAYRTVLADGQRRLATCRLDRELRVVPGSPYALSDDVRFAPGKTYPEVVRTWLADPRLYRFGDRVFIYWNSGWHEPQNHQFLQELEAKTFAPIGAPRELMLHGPRRPLEKNWTFFTAGDGALRAIYSVDPHVVLGFSLEEDRDMIGEETSRRDFPRSAYPACHGGLRGGAPPVWHDGLFWSFCHSVHDGPNGYCYRAGVYAFADGPDFAPVFEPLQPLEIGRGITRAYPRLNPAVDEVVYPCGAVLDGDRWLVSHGLHDEQCAISIVPHAAVLAHVRRV